MIIRKVPDEELAEFQPYWREFVITHDGYVPVETRHSYINWNQRMWRRFRDQEVAAGHWTKGNVLDRELFNASHAGEPFINFLEQQRAIPGHHRDPCMVEAMNALFVGADI